MGKGSHGGFNSTAGSSSSPHTLTDNLSKLELKYPLSRSGYFGTVGDGSKVRHIASRNPIATANDFYNIATEKFVSERDIGNGKGRMATMRDGTTISIREISSSDGSPAIDIKIYSVSRVKGQKIHFIKEKNK